MKHLILITLLLAAPALTVVYYDPFKLQESKDGPNKTIN